MRVSSRGESIGGPDVYDDLRQNFGFHSSYSGIHPSYFLSHILLGLVSALVRVSFEALYHANHVMCECLAIIPSVKV
jgi:hypothetical protein